MQNVFDPEDNIRGGMKYLRWLLAYFEGRLPLVLAGYNAGEGAPRGVWRLRQTAHAVPSLPEVPMPRLWRHFRTDWQALRRGGLPGITRWKSNT
ncbi:hypothetical protein WCLP8_460003 [uncultured Gammaproteobacteria bacterium]